MARGETSIHFGGGGDRRGHPLSPLKHIEKGALFAGGLTPDDSHFTARQVGWGGVPGKPWPALAVTFTLCHSGRSRCCGWALGSRGPPGGAVATRPAACLPSGSAAATTQPSAAWAVQEPAPQPLPPAPHCGELAAPPAQRGIWLRSTAYPRSGAACSPRSHSFAPNLLVSSPGTRGQHSQATPRTIRLRCPRPSPWTPPQAPWGF